MTGRLLAGLVASVREICTHSASKPSGTLQDCRNPNRRLQAGN